MPSAGKQPLLATYWTLGCGSPFPVKQDPASTHRHVTVAVTKPNITSEHEQACITTFDEHILNVDLMSLSVTVPFPGTALRMQSWHSLVEMLQGGDDEQGRLEQPTLMNANWHGMVRAWAA